MIASFRGVLCRDMVSGKAASKWKSLRRVVLFSAAVVATCQSSTRAESPVDRFLREASSHEILDAEAKRVFQEAVSRCGGCDPAELLAQGLTMISPAFRNAMDAYENEEFEKASSTFATLEHDENPFLALHAAAFRAKALIELDRCLDAQPVLDRLTESMDLILTHTYLAAELSFLRGFCLLNDLKYVEARVAIGSFLHDHPQAPQRLTVAARQMMQELDLRDEGRIGEVVDLMRNSKLRLETGDSGVIVQERQTKIVDLLDQLIEEEEEKEKQACKKSGSGEGKQGGQQPQQQQQGGGSQQIPMPDSSLPGGSVPLGPLREPRRANPAEQWGAMPPADRERILQALRESFPSRYRQLVEQYYEELAKKP